MKQGGILLIVLSLGLLASCSQSKQVAAAPQKAHIRYHKVYEGNKIIYHKKEAESSPKLALGNADARHLEPPEEVGKPLAARSPAHTKKSIEENIAPAVFNFTAPVLDQYKKARFLKNDGLQMGSFEIEDFWALLGFAIAIALVVMLIIAFTSAATVPFLLLIGLGVFGALASAAGIDSDFRVLAIIGLIICSLVVLGVLVMLTLLFIWWFS